MSRRRDRKRKASKATASAQALENGGTLTPPDRSTWPGWVEMESEPAFFNVMLKEMGVRGIKIQEVLGIDEEMLAILPRPAHGLIFLFRYKDIDESQQQEEVECPEHIWFANQIPDFACASVALLNIVNNIKGVQIGKELRDFRDFTQDMDPISRGDAIDSFDFIRHIHNSFARDTDLLIADMHMKSKANKARKKQATAKARATKEAKKASKTILEETSPDGRAAPSRTSSRTSKSNDKATPTRDSSPLSDPPESDPEFQTSNRGKGSKSQSSKQPRRSERKPKPRKNSQASAAADADEEEEGFHFIAYMPIQGHVWKLDGLDSFPQDMGAFKDGPDSDWINVALPTLQTRMAMFEGTDIEFNLMAVVHDAELFDRRRLVQNVVDLQKVDKKLDTFSADWRDSLDLELNEDVISFAKGQLGILQRQVEDLDPSVDAAVKTPSEEEASKLLESRKQLVSQQGPLRAIVRDAMEASKSDDEQARHRRHNYGDFVRSWLGALFEQEVLGDLLESP